MKNDFLPKALNGIPGRRACISLNYGQMSTEPHYHDCVEIIYVQEGTLRTFFNNGWHELSSGSLLFVPPGCIHRCIANDGTKQTVIGFTDDLLCENGSDIKGAFRPYRSGEISTGYIIENCGRLGADGLIGELSETNGSEIRDTLSLYAGVLKLYCLIYEVWEKRGEISERAGESLNAHRIKKYVRENFSSKISARELSDELNISYSYLSKIMMREFGICLSDYVISVRIEYAKKLLLATAKSVAEVGYECGFASSSAFISHFKSQTGKTPLVFRTEALGDA